MLEGDANNLPYGVFKSAVSYGVENAAGIAQQLEKLNKPKKRLYSQPTGVPTEMIEDVTRYIHGKCPNNS